MPARSHLTFANGILMERYMITADRVAGIDPGSARPVIGSSTTLPKPIRRGVISDVVGPVRRASRIS
jgi:hypothetical protein